MKLEFQMSHYTKIITLYSKEVPTFIINSCIVYYKRYSSLL